MVSTETTEDRPRRRLIREKEVRDKLGGIGTTKFWQIRRLREFPEAVGLGPRTLAWDEAAVDAFIDSRPRVRTMSDPDTNLPPPRRKGDDEKARRRFAAREATA
jgi:predicted DNA-binding transcriptional regulator AlpA